MTYADLLNCINAKKDVPIWVSINGNTYKVAMDKTTGEIIDYYCGGTALSEHISAYYLCKQAQLELVGSNKKIM